MAVGLVIIGGLVLAFLVFGYLELRDLRNADPLNKATDKGKYAKKKEKE